MGASGGGIFSGGGFFNTGPSGDATLTVTNSTISGNSAESHGGGIFNDGFAGTAMLTITNSIISDNKAMDNFNDYGFGGGIYNNGDSGLATVTLTNCTFSHNSTSTFGGAICNNCNLTTDGPLIFGPVTGVSTGGLAVDYQVNFAAGQEYVITEMAQPVDPTENFDAIIAVIDPNGKTILDQDTYVDETVIFVAPVTGQYTVRVHPFFLDDVPTMGHFTLRINSATRNSPGTANMTFNNCTISGNSGGGGIYSYCLFGSTILTFTNSVLTSNDGSGIEVQNDFGTAQLTLNSCLLDKNASFYGGAIAIQDTEAVLINTRMTQNSAYSGGGLSIDVSLGSQYTSRVSLTDCTVDSNSASNDGGGIYNQGTALAFTNCSISGNSAGIVRWRHLQRAQHQQRYGDARK